MIVCGKCSVGRGANGKVTVNLGDEKHAQGFSDSRDKKKKLKNKNDSDSDSDDNDKTRKMKEKMD